MTDAEATVKFAILNGIASTYGDKPEDTRDAVFANLFDPSLIWAVRDHLKMLDAV